MWRKTKVFFAVSLVMLSLGLTISSVYAQESSRDAVGARTTMMSDDNDGFEFGWLGLGGLIGLVGLMPRDRQDRRDQDLKR